MLPLLGLCAGCFAGTPQTTAYPVPRGKIEGLAALDGTGIVGNYADAVGFMAGGGARVGLGHNMDVGVRLSYVYAAADFKLTLWKDSIAAVALLPRVQGSWPVLGLMLDAPVLFTARFGDVVSVTMMGGYRHLLSKTMDTASSAFFPQPSTAATSMSPSDRSSPSPTASASRRDLRRVPHRDAPPRNVHRPPALSASPLRRRAPAVQGATGMRNRALALALPVLCAGCFTKGRRRRRPIRCRAERWSGSGGSLDGVVIANNLTDAAGFTGGAGARLGWGTTWMWACA